MSILRRLEVVARPLKHHRNSLISSRAYGSAAAVEVQYDDYEDEEVEELQRIHGDRGQARFMVDSEAWVPGRGVQWVVLGDPGTKKHVYAERLAKLLDVPHISMGCLVRQELSPRSSIYQQIAKSVNEGKPVPEEIIFGLLSKRLEEGYCSGETGFILEGIPRTRNQAEILDQIADIDLVINFKSIEEPLIRKTLGPQTFSNLHEYRTMSGSGSNINLQPQGREPKSLMEQSKPLEDYYRRQRKLVDFQVTGAPGETWQGLLEALHLQHINAKSSTQKLTA